MHVKPLENAMRSNNLPFRSPSALRPKFPPTQGTLNPRWGGTRTPEDPPHKVSGKYDSLVEAGKIPEAASLLNFSDLAQRFLEVGVAPNHTDEKCADFIAELSYTPIAKMLRGGIDLLGDAASFANDFLSTVQQHFSSIASLQSVVECFQSLKVLLDVANDPQTRQRPSIVKQALQHIACMPATSPILLATQHGTLGRHLRGAGSQVVTQSAQDSIGRDKLRAAMSDLQGVLGLPIDKHPTDVIRKALDDLASALKVLTSASVEELASDIEEVFRLIDRVGKRAEAQVWKSIAPSDAEALSLVIDKFEARRSAADAAASDPSAVKREHDEAAQLLPTYFEDTEMPSILNPAKGSMNMFRIMADRVVDIAEISVKLYNMATLSFNSAGVCADNLLKPSLEPAVLGARLDLLRNMLSVFICLECFGPRNVGQDYKAILNEWAKTREVGEADMLDDKWPLLSMVTEGAGRANLLHNSIVKLEDTEGLDDEVSASLLDKLCNSSISKAFAELVANFVSDALGELRANSLSNGLMIQDADAINKCKNAGELADMSKSLLGDGASNTASASINQALSDIVSKSVTTLADGGHVDWPHRLVGDIAARCVNLLPPGEEARIV